MGELRFKPRQWNRVQTLKMPHCLRKVLLGDNASSITLGGSPMTASHQSITVTELTLQTPCRVLWDHPFSVPPNRPSRPIRRMCMCVSPCGPGVTANNLLLLRWYFSFRQFPWSWIRLTYKLAALEIQQNVPDLTYKFCHHSVHRDSLCSDPPFIRLATFI